MGATNSTPNIQLPSFIGTDKPSWLGDWNSAMTKIDTKFGTVDGSIGTVTNTANAAQTAAEAASQGVTTLQGTVTQHTSEISDVMADVSSLEADVTQLQNTVNNIPQLIINELQMQSYNGANWVSFQPKSASLIYSATTKIIFLNMDGITFSSMPGNYFYAVGRTSGNIFNLTSIGFPVATATTTPIHTINRVLLHTTNTDAVTRRAGLIYNSTTNFTYLVVSLDASFQSQTINVLPVSSVLGNTFNASVYIPA